MTQNSIRLNSGLALALALLLMFSGCSQGARGLKLDQDVGRASLKTSLETWQRGGKPDELKNQKPSIIFGEDACREGLKLVAFKILPEEKNDGTNLHIPVEVQIQDAAGQIDIQYRTYIVGTSPAITIFPE